MTPQSPKTQSGAAQEDVGSGFSRTYVGPPEGGPHELYGGAPEGGPHELYGGPPEGGPHVLYVGPLEGGPTCLLRRTVQAGPRIVSAPSDRSPNGRNDCDSVTPWFKHSVISVISVISVAEGR